MIEVTGHETFPTTGELDLTTVSVTSPDRDLTLPQAMRNWLDPHHDLFPRDIIYPPEQSADEVEQQNTAEMTGSQDSAVAAALQEAPRCRTSPKVSSVSKGSPADGKLKPGDVVLKVDGVAATQVPQVGELVRKKKVGENVSFLIRRGGVQQTVVVKTAATPGEETRPMVGISIGVDSPVKVSVNLGQDIGGPSAGTAFALAIYDKLTPGAAAGRQAHRRDRDHRRARPGRRDRRHPAEDRRREGDPAPPSSWSRDRTAQPHCTPASRTSSW